MEEVTDLPGLDPASMRAFRIGPNQIGVVQLTRGVPTEHFMPVKVVAWLVDDNGDPVRVGNACVRIPAAYRSLSNAALASGTLTLENEMADLTLDALDRLRQHYAAMLAWFRLPADPAEAANG